jgi:hypothetical protein
MRLYSTSGFFVKLAALAGGIVALVILTTGNGSPTQAATTATVGPINTAVIAANFSDSSTSVDMNAIKAVFQGNPGADVVSYFQEASYGKASIVPSFYGPYTLGQSTSIGCSDGNLIQNLMNAANADVTYTQFRRLVFVVNCPGMGGSSTNEAPRPTPDGTVTAAITTVGPSYGQNTYVLIHELSHTLGTFQHHANLFLCLPASFTPPARFDAGCDSVEYGDEFDVLGGTGTKISQLNPFHKANAGWLDAAQFPSVTTSGTYTLAPYELPTSGVLALNIPRGQSGTSFTVEYRQSIGFDAWMGSPTDCRSCTVTQGASIRLANFYTPGSGGGGDTQAIDTTPGSINWGYAFYPTEDNHDGALLPGRTFTDPEYGISITALSAGPTGLGIQVTIPSQDCTRAPATVTAPSPATQTASPGQTKTYTATLTNRDSAGCPANLFRYSSPASISGVRIVADPDYLTLSPGASATISLAVSASATTTDGTYSFSTSSAAGAFFSNSLGVNPGAVPSLTYQLSSTADTTVPSAPSGLTAQALGSSAVKLNWQPASDNVGVVGYTIKNSAGYLYTTTDTTFVDPSAAPAVASTYTVQAFDRQRNVSPTAAVSVTTPAKTDASAPSAATVTASAGDHSLSVSWAGSSDNVGVAYYQIYPCLVPSCVLPASVRSFTVDGLATRTRFDLQVVAVDGDGNMSAGTSYTVYTAAAGTSAPTQPQHLVASAAKYGRLDLSWTASTDDRGVAGYDIYRNNRKIATVTSNSFSDTTAVGTPQYFIQAVDGDGSLSAPSNRVSFSVPASSTDSTPPTASITSPADGGTVSGGVGVTAAASDNVAVKKVELYVDGVLAATSTASPYSFAWDTTSAGNGAHWLYARAYDAAGNYGSAGVTLVTVDNGGSDVAPPTVSVLAPTAGSTVSGSVSVAAAALDNVGVTKVELRVDGTLKGTDTSAPYTFAWDSTADANGAHVIAAQAFDAAGNSESATAAVTTANASGADPTPSPSPTVPPVTPPATPVPATPAVSITQPLDGSTVPVGKTIKIAASASDDVGVTKVEFYVNGARKCSDTAAPFTCAWRVGSVTGATYSLTARAYDAAGHVASYTVSVVAGRDTTVPTVFFTSPASGGDVTVNSTVAMAASAADEVGVGKVEFFVNGSRKCSDSAAPFTCAWKVGSAPSVTYTLLVKATDVAGNVGSQTLTVTSH